MCEITETENSSLKKKHEINKHHFLFFFQMIVKNLSKT